MTFARFMETALTHPTLGYYSQAGRLLRHGGDFNTAPGLSPFFNRTMARLVTELVDLSLSALPAQQAGGEGEPGAGRAAVMEQGGGEGQLAAAILEFWERERPELRGKIAYRIVEVGARLQQRQAAAVAPSVEAGWDVGWGRDPKEACAGSRPVVVVGNEFLDAVPVHLVRVAEGALSEAYVEAATPGTGMAGAPEASTGAPSLELTWGPLSDAAAAELESLFGPLEPGRLAVLTEDGIIEVFPGLGDLVRQVVEVMPSGTFVNVDYGEWFPGVPRCGERWGLEGRTKRRRTVRGYFKHQMVLDPLARAGRQDLTADVDFAAVDLHGRQHGFETVVFTTLAAFLRGGGAQAELEALRGDPTAPGLRGKAVLQTPNPGEAADVLEADRQATVIHNLLDESDLGGAFKVMVQVRE